MTNLIWFAEGLRRARVGGVEYGYAHSTLEPDQAFAVWLQAECGAGWLDSYNEAQQGQIRDCFMEAWTAWSARAAIIKPMLTGLAANCNELPERKAQ